MLVIVCLSTIPSRVQYLPLTVKSLLEQTVKPDRIHIFIPRWSNKEQCVYPPLDEYNEYVNLVESDEGPITKLYPVLQMYPDAGPDDLNMVVINVDDDTVYNERTIESLVAAHIRSDNQKDVVALSGWIMNGWTNVRFPSDRVRVDWGEATNAILYPMITLRNIQDSALLAFELMPEARGCDDIWIAAWIQHSTPDCSVYAVPLLCEDLMNRAQHAKTPAVHINSLLHNVTSVETAQQNMVTGVLRMMAKNRRVSHRLRNQLSVFHTPALTVNQMPSVGLCSSYYEAIAIVVMILIIFIILSAWSRSMQCKNKCNRRE